MTMNTKKYLEKMTGQTILAIQKCYHNYSDYDVLKITTESGNFIVKNIQSPQVISCLRKEKRVIDYLIAQKMSTICEPIHFINDEDGHLISIQKFTAGTPLYQFNDADLDVKMGSELLFTALKNLHEIPMPDDSFLCQLLDNHNESFHGDLKKIQHLEILPKSTLQWVEEFVDTTELSEGKLCFLHGDLSPMNIIITIIDTKYHLTLIDFEKSHFGNPMKDVAKLIWFFRTNPQIGNRFIDQYLAWNTMVSRKKLLQELKIYFIIDIVHHFSEYKHLIKNPVWIDYFKEEEILLYELIREKCLLW